MLVGTNPVLSHQLLGFLASDPTKRLKEHRARGLILITVDPRKPIPSHYSSLVVQPFPGFDSHILARSEENASELQSLMRISYALFCLIQRHIDTTSTEEIYTSCV